MNSETPGAVLPAPSFPSTRWTGLLRIREAGWRRAPEQIQELCSLYWPAVRATIAGDWIRNPEDADDAAQEFFLGLLERDFSKDLSPDKGRFRHFIKAALKNFLMNRRRDGARLKRGGGLAAVSLDEAGDVAAKKFDAEWRSCLMNAAMERLRGTCDRAERPVSYEAFRLHYVDSPLSLPEIASRLGLAGATTANHVKWARTELRRIVLELIQDYAGDAETARRELEELFGS